MNSERAVPAAHLRQISSLDLQRRIEDFWSELKEESAFFRKARAGTVTGKELGRLLGGTRHLIQHTPVFLDMALLRASTLEERWPFLLSYFREGRDHEVGHEQWAQDDLARLRRHRSDVEEALMPAIHDLVAYIRVIIERDVVLLVAYILCAEHLVVVSADELATTLRERCQVPPEVLSVFLRHAELDKGHTNDDLAIIERILQSEPAYGARFLEVIDSASRIYRCFWEELAA